MTTSNYPCYNRRNGIASIEPNDLPSTATEPDSTASPARARFEDSQVSSDPASSASCSRAQVEAALGRQSIGTVTEKDQEWQSAPGKEAEWWGPANSETGPSVTDKARSDGSVKSTFFQRLQPDWSDPFDKSKTSGSIDDTPSAATAA
jgi:hypothetical protein